jgi:membrane protein DedA with SNARE-associated domain
MEHFLTSWGYAALILLCVAEAACIPMSSEVTFGFAGVLAYQGHLNLALVIIIGTLAEMVGSLISFYVGRIGGRPLVDKVGRYVLITRSDVDRAERFLVGRGAWAVPVARIIPFVRAFASIVSGLVEVPPLRFGVLSLIGTAIYATAMTLIGYAVGSAWSSVSHSLSLATYAIVAIVVVVVVVGIVHRYRQFRREQASAPEAPRTPAGGRHGR